MPTINGTSGADTLIGVGSTTFNAGDGDDVVIATATGNIIRGEGGNDILVGRGNDLIEGGDGDDLILAAGSNNQLYGGAGNDRIVGGAGIDTFYGGDGDDIIEMGTARNIDEGTAGDVAYGGEGNDIYRFAIGAVIHDTGGIDTLDFSGIEDQYIYSHVLDMKNGRFAFYSGNDLLETSFNHGRFSPDHATEDMQFMVLQDVTSTMEPDFGRIRSALPNLYYELARFGYRSETVSLTQFADREPGTVTQGTIIFQSNPFGDLSTPTQLISVDGNTTTKDGQIEALMHMARNAAAFGFQASTQLKVVMVATDSLPHVAGDLSGLSPNNGDGVMDNKEDYPSVEQLRVALLDAGIIPIFSVKEKVLADYQALVKQLGFGSVTLLAADSSNYVSAAMDGMYQLPQFQNVIENLIGTSTGDIITGNFKDNVIHGGGGRDIIYGENGNDTIDGGSDHDTLRGGSGDDLLYGAQGDDQLFGDAGDDTFFVYRDAPEAYEEEHDAARAEVIQVSDSSGQDTLDFSLGRTAAVIRLETGGVSTLDNRQVVLQGTTVIENAVGTAFADDIVGNNSANRLDGGAGADTMAGGLGNDVYVVDNIGDLVIEAANAGTDRVEAHISYTLTANVETLVLMGTATEGIGNELANTIIGNAANNILRGGDGNDRLTGAGGKDVLYGGSGADTFAFTQASHSIVGDMRDVIADWSASDFIDLTGLDAKSGTAGTQRFVFVGQGAADRVIGPGQLKFYQYGGNTFIVGGIDADNQADFQIEITGLHNIARSQLIGIAATNLVSTTGDDALVGTDGADLVYGNLGKDTMQGGLGADTFQYRAAAESAVGDRRDVILDWESIDKIDLALLDADAVTAGNQDFSFIGLGPVGRDVGLGQVKFYHFGGNTYVVGNADGDGQADFQIELVGIHTLTADNFIGAGGTDIIGTSGDDTLRGTAANETLTGGLGRDMLYGGGGADTFIYASVNDSLAGTTRDIIADWDALDKIRLTAIDADSVAAGNQDFIFDGAGTADRNVASGHVKYYQIYGNTYVVADTTGDGQADLQIEITGLHTLTTANFEL